MFDKKLVAISVATAFISPFTAANTQDKDSVYEYGPWGQNYATAAGGEFNTNSLSFGSFSGNESGRNGQNEPGFNNPVNDGACSAGTYCGFAEISGDYGDSTDDDVGFVNIDANPSHFSNGPYQGGLTGGFQVNGNDTESFGIDGMEGAHDGDYGNMYNYNQGSGATGYVMYYSSPYPSPYPYTGWYAYNSESYSSNGQIYGGITTSLDQLNAFAFANPTATYNGVIKDGGLFSLTINFGPNTWNGTFYDAKGTANGFNVTNGSVSGINFSANSEQLNALGASVSGSVNGAIFGQTADKVAGMIDITKTYGGPAAGSVDRQTLFRSVPGMEIGDVNVPVDVPEA
jgi:hypothetical protein